MHHHHLIPRIVYRSTSTIIRALSTTTRPSSVVVSHLLPQHRIHLLFGANTDVGKSIVSTGLVRAAAVASEKVASSSSVNYIKPMQCGGSDESFVLSHHNDINDKHQQKSIGNNNINCHTLFTWKTPASPHLVSRWENLPVSDEEVLSSLQSTMKDITSDANEECNKSSDEVMRSITIIESAGGVLSPSSSSPLNKSTTDNYWGWSTQADLYASLNIPVVFVGDGKLGGISVTLASLEALWSRGYRVDAIVFIEGVDNGDEEDSNIQFGKGNTEALREYISMQQLLQNQQKVPKTGLDDSEEKITYLESLDHDSIICLPPLPPMPVPLDDWYESNQDTFLKLHRLLCSKWRDNFDDYNK